MSAGEPATAGLASVLDGLVRQNLERDPARRRWLRPFRAVIEVPDAGVVATVAVDRAGVRVEPTDDPSVRIRVRADAQRLLGLAAVPLVAGLPDVRTPDGRRVLADLASGRVRVRGLLGHLGDVRRLTMLLSAR